VLADSLLFSINIISPFANIFALATVIVFVPELEIAVVTVAIFLTFSPEECLFSEPE